MYFRKRLDVQLVYSWCFLVSMCHLVVNFVKLLLLFFFLCDIRANQPNDRPSVCLFICPFEIYFSFLSLFYIVEFFSVFFLFYYMGRLLNKMFPSSLFSSSVADNLFTNSYCFRLYIFYTFLLALNKNKFVTI